MAGFQILLDPTAEGTGTQLDITSSTLGYYLIEQDYPTPDNEDAWASSSDTEGARRSNTRVDNRTITLKVRCIEPNSGTPEIGLIVNNLQAKIAKMHREGGTLRTIYPSGDPITFDVLSAKVDVPNGHEWLHNKRADVTLTFICKPYGRGAEVDLGDNVETTAPALIFTDTNIPGDVPALGRLVIDNDSDLDQATLRWGLQSRHYSNASSAALFYPAESCSLYSGTVVTGPAGATGAGTNNTVRVGGSPYSFPHYSVGWVSPIVIGPSDVAQTHVGDFRVFARIYVETNYVDPLMIRASWSPGATDDQFTRVSNPWRVIENSTNSQVPYGDTWLLADLGNISIPKARAGNQGWLGTIDVATSDITQATSDKLYVDYVMFIPTSEASGVAVGLAGNPGFYTIPARGQAHIRHDGAFLASNGYLANISRYQGDYLTIPPSGPEGRTTRVIVKMTANDGFPTPFPGTRFINFDGSVDDLSARLYVTPRYLVVPAP